MPAKYPKAVIDNIKANTHFLSLLKDYGLSVVQKGRNHFVTCPFHDVDGHPEKTPSLSIDPEQNLYHCFSCDAGGDVIGFVQAMDNIQFKPAVEKLLNLNGIAPKPAAKAKSKSDLPVISPEERETILRSFLAAASDSLRNSKAGRNYLEKRGLNPLDLLNSHELGFCPKSLFSKLADSEKKKLQALGLMNEKGRLHFEGCVLFPLIEKGRVVSVYGRRITKSSGGFAGHVMLPDVRGGLYLPTAGLNSRKKLIITESVLDALSLFTAGVTNVLPLCGVNGFYPDHLDYLKEQNFPEIIIAFDGDKPGRTAAAKLKEKLTEEKLLSTIIDLPDNEDFNSMLLDYGETKLKEWITHLLIREDKTAPSVSEENGFIFIQFENRIYRIQGLSTVGMDRLKVTVRIYTEEEPANFHMDSVDLYQARSRERLLKDSVNILRVKASILQKELNAIITILEEKRIAKTAGPEEKKSYQMSESEREEALQFLRAPNLLDRIADEFTNSGMVGNRTESVLAYLGSLTRLTDKPFGVLIVSRSGAGKSFLQEMTGSFVPKESLLRMTRLTGQSLFYQGKEGLKHKLLTIEEDEGMQDAMYSIRTLLSSQRLSLHSLKADQKTGDLKAYENTVEGPASVMISTTDLSRFDFESVNRFLVLFLDESQEQTVEILRRQNEMSGETKIKMKINSKYIWKRQQNVQRLIEPLTVVNPHGTGVSYPPQILNTRREQKKFAALIEVIALLHQHQREIKTTTFHGVTTRYVEVRQSDIDTAFALAGHTLAQSLDELSPLGRKLLSDIVELVQTKHDKEKQIKSDIRKWQVPFTRRELQDRCNWSVWHLRQHCSELVENGYITPRSGRKGQQYSYALVVDSIPDLPIIKRMSPTPK